MVVAVCNRMAADTTNTTITLHVAVSAATSTAALMECTSIEITVAVSAPEVTAHLDSIRILDHASVNVAHIVVLMRSWTTTPVNAERRASIQMCSAPLCSISMPASIQSLCMEYHACKSHFHTSLHT